MRRFQLLFYSGEQALPAAEHEGGGVRGARGAGHGRALPRLRHARPQEALLRDRHQGGRSRRLILRDCSRDKVSVFSFANLGFESTKKNAFTAP